MMTFPQIYLRALRGLVVKLWPCASKALSSIPGKTFFSSLLFFSFLHFFSFSFRLVFILGISVLLCFYIRFLDLQIFFSALLAVPPMSFARSCDLLVKYTWAGTLSKPCRAFRGEPLDKFYTSMI